MLMRGKFLLGSVVVLIGLAVIPGALLLAEVAPTLDTRVTDAELASEEDVVLRAIVGHSHAAYLVRRVSFIRRVLDHETAAHLHALAKGE